MKNFVITSIVLLLCSISCWGQEKIYIDFKMRTIDDIPKQMNEGDFYQLIIDCINPNIYDVVINNTDTIYSKKLEFATFSAISLDALTTLTESFDSGGLVQISELMTPGDSLTLPKNMDEIMLNLQLVEGGTPLQTLTPKEEIENLLINNQIIVLAIKDHITRFKTMIDNTIFKVYEYRLTSLYKTGKQSTDYDFRTALKELIDAREKLAKKGVEMNSVKAAFVKEIDKAPLKNIWEKDEGLKKQVNTVKEAYSKSIALVDELRAKINAENSEKLLRSVLFLDNSETFTSFPIQLNGEQAEVEVSFIPKDSTFGLSTIKIPPFKVVAPSKMYWNLSTGFYYSNLSNEQFSVVNTVANDSTQVFNVVREEERDREAGVVVAIKGGYKLNDYIGIHGSLGPGITIEKNIRPRLLGGIGVAIGKRNHLTLDFGAILGYVDRKSAVVDLSQDYSAAPDVTITKLVVANYFAIGYMFRL